MRRGGLAPHLVVIRREERLERELAQERCDQEADHALSEHEDALAEDGRGILDEVDGGLHIWEEAGRLRGVSIWKREDGIDGGDEVGGVRLEGENEPPGQAGADAGAELDHAANACITAAPRVVDVAAEAVMDFMHVFRELAAVNEELGARTDGGADGLDEDLVRPWRREGFHAKLNLVRSGDGEGMLVHWVYCTRLERIPSPGWTRPAPVHFGALRGEHKGFIKYRRDKVSRPGDGCEGCQPSCSSGFRFVEPEEDEVEDLSCLGIVAGGAVGAEDELLVTQEDPEHQGQQSVTGQSPPDHFMPLLKEGDGQEIRTEQREVSKPVQKDRVQFILKLEEER